MSIRNIFRKVFKHRKVIAVEMQNPSDKLSETGVMDKWRDITPYKNAELLDTLYEGRNVIIQIGGSAVGFAEIIYDLHFVQGIEDSDIALASLFSVTAQDMDAIWPLLKKIPHWRRSQAGENSTLEEYRPHLFRFVATHIRTTTSLDGFGSSLDIAERAYRTDGAVRSSLAEHFDEVERAYQKPSECHNRIARLFEQSGY